jgi:hypothetical protein
MRMLNQGNGLRASNNRGRLGDQIWTLIQREEPKQLIARNPSAPKLVGCAAATFMPMQ